ncbi:MAG: PsiF family protein [Nitrospira sp.]|nr:PsiF family protein [Nitrospira sp.]
MWRVVCILTLALCVLSLGPTPFVLAAPDQQNRMKVCNAQANAKGFGEEKGDERRGFMKECLSANSGKRGGGKDTQQNKMQMYSKEAGEKQLKGDERKKFMSDCLSA